MSSSLSVPYALARDGRQVLPEDARKRARRGEYRCPDCEHAVHRKGGPAMRRSAHFSHFAQSSRCCFNRGGPSEIHEAAVFEAQALVIRSQGPLSLLLECGLHGVINEVQVEVAGATTERSPRLNGGAITPDLGVRRADGRWLLLIEIRHTHAVDQDKREKLAALKLPWVELEVERAAIAPLKPVAHGGFQLKCCCARETGLDSRRLPLNMPGVSPRVFPRPQLIKEPFPGPARPQGAPLRRVVRLGVAEQSAAFCGWGGLTPWSVGVCNSCSHYGHVPCILAARHKV